MKGLSLMLPLLLVSCATAYRPEGVTGGYSDAMTGPDTAIVSFGGNGYTSENRLIAMLLVRCADITLQHGYRYFVITGAQDMGRVSSFTVPGSATTNTYGSFSYGGFSGTSYTTIDPPETVHIYKPAMMDSIKMSNSSAALQGLGMPILGGQRMTVFDAVAIAQGGRRYLGIKGS
jgi:hypothetical protein